MTIESEEISGVNANYGAGKRNGVKKIYSKDHGVTLEKELDLNNFGKKKKKRQNVKLEEIPSTDDVTGEANDVIKVENDLDLTYEQLLRNIFDLIKKNHPDLIPAARRTIHLPTPVAMRVGSNKSALINFMDICRFLHREPSHLATFILTEFATSGAVDGCLRLILRGRFRERHFEVALKSYVRSFVLCSTCRSMETILIKENRLIFLKCMTCHSKFTVQKLDSK